MKRLKAYLKSLHPLANFVLLLLRCHLCCHHVQGHHWCIQICTTSSGKWLRFKCLKERLAFLRYWKLSLLVHQDKCPHPLPHMATQHLLWALVELSYPFGLPNTSHMIRRAVTEIDIPKITKGEGLCISFTVFCKED
ncbi:hypothetical protein CMV_011707 [Castanea mollissima]|uniref:Secreted protein n=1 Tax=Castanea mollissima TaxID=60419 RepID=A0A8J4R2S0_9ROSI|nr:hypothetical protein CMV_011707 [Castanea mollissima]